MTPDLPDSYYLDNVTTLFDHIEATYADILPAETIDFLKRFEDLDEDARKLYIRLLNRSYNWFRVSKLNYSEISSIEKAIDKLCQFDCLRLNPEIPVDTLISLFTKPELFSSQLIDSTWKTLRREELETKLLTWDNTDFYQHLLSSDDFLEVIGNDQYQLCQMLFFGNLNQSMTDFVLRDLGLNRYESYLIDLQHRPYQSSLEIQQHWLLYQLDALYRQINQEDLESLSECLDLIPADIESDAPAYRFSQHLRFEIARQIERIGELDMALDAYQLCVLPPARERVARIKNSQGQHKTSLHHCLEMIEEPLNDAELHFACQFASRLCKRHQIETPGIIQTHAISHKPDIIDLELDQHESVEAAVAEHLGQGCYYVENSLFNSVLGLLFWEVIFAPVSGAFYNPFQHRPSDLYTPDFHHRRQKQVEHLWQSIQSNQDIWELVEKRWHEKHGVMNPLVMWQNMELEIIQLALERIGFKQWLAVFKRILLDIRGNRAGFPDLVHFPPEGGYQLVEVKGPGDTLQKNQQRWMQYFKQHQIPHYLARVTWRKI
ncbi:MAG: VRR-NUC domain-containing protein [Pseudomonadota bacterium]